ncbi:hypothetical protein DNTS_009410 [Danionella cerebrum]|uniref:tRNA-binding domain-containing protein n=1 Tax=Danionella cerebrum TaxID=2873325 RepID=A0A553NGE6_9TELE|nr:hypothetical protein DNTS_009410 [Danionella translucida]TRY64499.1 hypothetical protein DNTS_009410 [Danionella translucida]TRY64500.1 hypothetical protein DNTS_009410 [Danionella translucida]TRY64501.1 hypothetical protein DNTS_009410 [Danionella translucida]TRY64502.1 hypothetical protein DNTS_009410 [Danionella translucida]
MSDAEKQMKEFVTQQVLLLREKASHKFNCSNPQSRASGQANDCTPRKTIDPMMLQASVREEKKLLVENAKLKKDIDDLKNMLHETQKKKTEQALTASIASTAVLLGESSPKANTKAQRALERSGASAEMRAAQTHPNSRSRRSRRGVRPDAPCTCDVSHLDLRVGRILDIRDHPDSSSLYVQEVELGEHGPRTVVSARPDHVTLDQLRGSLVVALCNVRSVKVRGVQSQARLLCAVNQDQVELLAPPSIAQPGDRVMVNNYFGNPERELNPKHRIWERLLPDLCTDAKGVVTYKGTPLEVRGKGFCRAPNTCQAAIQ